MSGLRELEHGGNTFQAWGGRIVQVDAKESGSTSLTGSCDRGLEDKAAKLGWDQIIEGLKCQAKQMGLYYIRIGIC